MQAHQVGLCQEDDGSRYGCIHIDGRQAGPASLLVTAYYGKSQGTCSAASSFGTSEYGSSSSSVLASAFGTGLDNRFNSGQKDLPPCCLNTVLLSVDVVEPLTGDAPVALNNEKSVKASRARRLWAVRQCPPEQEAQFCIDTVSYTHLTLPTNREV